MFRKRIKRVLVVGGRGFIGSHLMSSGLFDEVESPKFLASILDIKDGALGDVKSEAWKDNEYDFIVFLACNFEESMDGYLDNLRMVAAVGTYLEQHPKTHLIFTSSAAVYQDGYWSMKETDVHPLGAPTYYGQGKVLGETALSASSRNVTVFRLSNVYGKGGRGVIDLFKNGSRVIYGTGMQVRDFVHVDQVVNAITETLKRPKHWRGVYNVSSGVGQTVLSVYGTYVKRGTPGRRTTGQGSPIFKKARLKDVKFSVLDNTKYTENL